AGRRSTKRQLQKARRKDGKKPMGGSPAMNSEPSAEKWAHLMGKSLKLTVCILGLSLPSTRKREAKQQLAQQELLAVPEKPAYKHHKKYP
ncbi:unnamed protein product, partial [Sphagnum tenellum]